MKAPAKPPAKKRAPAKPKKAAAPIRTPGELTPKRMRFVEEYIVDMNATRSYRAAGYRGSDNVCAVQAMRLLRNTQIAAAITKAIEARSKRTEVSSDWLLKRLAAEAQADVADLYDETGDLRPVRDWPLIWRQGLVAGIESVREKIGDDGDGEPVYAMVRKVKLSDRGKRLELIGRHVDVQAFRERVDVNVKQDLASMLAERRRRAMARDE